MLQGATRRTVGRKKALELFDCWKADRIVAEKNFGGAMVESTIRTGAKKRAGETAERLAREGAAGRAGGGIEEITFESA